MGNRVQGVHESQGVTEEYLKLESLLQKVVSPYLGTHGLCAHDCDAAHCSCVIGEKPDSDLMLHFVTQELKFGLIHNNNI